MKNWILSLAIVIAAQTAMGLGADDFNQMIQENQKAESELRHHLQKEAGIQLNDQYGKIAKDKMVVPQEAEQVVVSSGNLWNETAPSKQARKLEKKEMKRLSQELKDAEN